MDFTLETYKKLIQAFKESGFTITTVENYYRKSSLFRNNSEDYENVNKLSQSNYSDSTAENENGLYLVLRHDVDRKPKRAIVLAELENKLGVNATYYFRTKSQTFKPRIIGKVEDLGHEVGYHYESLSEQNGDYKKAIEDFKRNLGKLRKICSVETISMHGQALSKWDNRELWDDFDYRQFGIICEPYLDFDYSELLYLTDTGQKWNGDKYSLRDKVPDKSLSKRFRFNNSFDIIDIVEKNKLKCDVLMNVHPERWNDNFLLWLYYYSEQLIKRNIKLLINTFKKNDIFANN